MTLKKIFKKSTGMYLQGNGCGWTKQSWTTLTGLMVNLVNAAPEGLALQLGSGVQPVGSILDHTFAKQPKVKMCYSFVVLKESWSGVLIPMPLF